MIKSFSAVIILGISSVIFFSSMIYPQKVIKNGNLYYLSNKIVIKLIDRPVDLGNGKVLIPASLLDHLDNINLISAEVIFPGNRNYDLNKIIKINYDSDLDPLFISSKITKLKEVEWAEPKYLYAVDYVPNDPSYTSQYNLTKINAPAAWDITKGDTNIVIGIVDTGVDWDHPDLNANIWINGDEIPNNSIDDDNNGFIDDIRGWDFGGLVGIPDNDPVEDQPEHGTHVAGIASAVTDNSVGIASIGFNTKIMAVKTSQDNIRNAFGQALISYGYEGIVYAADNGAKVINLSWGGAGFSIYAQEVISYALSKGALVVAAAGNNNSLEPFYPASYINVLSVASTNSGDVKSSFSNYGSNIDVCAPGSDIYSTWQNNTYAFSGGTSMSSPLAAGLAALVCSRFPGYTPLQIAEQVRVTSDDIYSINPAFQYLLGKGRINAFNSVSLTSTVSVRAIEFNFSDLPPGGNGDGLFQPGETITLAVVFTNYLNPAVNLSISLVSMSPDAQVVNGSFSPGAVGTLEQFNNNDSKFSFTLSDSLPQNSDIQFRLDFTDNAYSDFQLTRIIGNPTYANQNNGEVELTITSKGTLAFNDYPLNLQGRGFRYQSGQNHLFEGALMLGTSVNKLSNSARGIDQNVQDPDFQNIQPFTIQIPGEIADQQGLTIFNDNGAGGSKLGVTVKLQSYSYSDPPHNKYIILRYSLTNNNSTALNNLFAGLFFDWDLVDGSGQGDSTKYYDQENFGYAYHPAGNPDNYVGAALISSNAYGYYGIKNDNTSGINIYDGFSDQEKWLALSSGIGNTGAGLGDISNVISGGPFTIQPAESFDVAFAVGSGDNLEELSNAVDNARQKYQVILDNPEEIPAAPVSFNLYQNYPNPFNPLTKIKYSVGNIVSQVSNVKLTIYDILGKKIAVLVNEEQRAGEYEVNFDASKYNLPSGVYFYELRAGSFTQTNKLIFMK